jgi:hypothetical protein
MKLDPRGRAKLARVVSYGAVALVVAWSLLALAGYAVVGVVGSWMASLTMADGWVASTGELIGQAGGPAVLIVWLAGTLAILGALALIRRLAV